MNRKEVLKEITKLTETHCDSCEIMRDRHREKKSIEYCIRECPIGQEFRKLGEMLAPNSNPGFSTRLNPINIRYAHITKELILSELATGKTYKEIEISLGIPYNTLKFHLKHHGIQGRRGSQHLTIKGAKHGANY